jgi:LmbE family N-acetylglucosaminyl deacetylase
MKKKILVVAAHPDDEILGCGGTILKHINNGDDVNILFISDGESSRKNGTSIKIDQRKKKAIKVARLLGSRSPIFLNLKDNSLDGYLLLEIIKKIELVFKKIRPEIIYTHFKNDLNVDHQITYKAVMTVCRPGEMNFVKEIYSFEISSSTDWAHPQLDAFRPNVIVDIGRFLKKKISLIKIYSKELRRYPHSRSLKSIKNKSQFRGNQFSLKHAEAFELIRLLR